MATQCPKCKAENPDTKQFCGDCGTQLTPAEETPVPTQTIEAPREELTTGSTFAGRYQIIEELGRGGMGRVYKATDTKIKEKVALKLIKLEIASDKKTLERFGNELRIARKIVHKNVGRMYDINEDEGIHYITMEYVSGQDLKGFIRQSGQMGVGTAISIIKQVCEGLSEAHKTGVIHRDLKPSNIMIDREGNVRIMDFGIARSLKEKGITGAGVMIGTPEYMSPEQAEAKEVDHRSDIYSLGVIIYEMVTGRVPFEGDTALSIAMRHKGEVPKNPKEYNAQVPDDLSKLILKCLEKDKDSRFQSAGAIQSELENIEKGIPTTDRAIPRRKPLTSKEITVTFGLKKLLVPALALVAVVIIAVVIWKPWSKKAPTPLPSDKPFLAVVYFENNTGDEDLDHWRKGISDLLITDLTQSKYLTVLSGDRLFNILSQLNQLDARSYSSDVLAEVASRGRVNHILRGSYSKAGDIIRIDIMLQDAGTGEPIATERVEGTGEESIFSLVDDLTRRVKASFKFSEEKIAGDLDKQVGEITTSSPEAYKYYLEGIRFERMGDVRKAIEFYEKAVAVDSGFASAYSELSRNYWDWEMSKGKKYAQKAFELRDRVSDKERYLIEAELYSYSEKTYDKAIEAYKKVLELYPEDVGAITDLGLTYIWIEEWDKAIEILNVSIRNKSESVYPSTILSLAYVAKGLYEKAIEVLEFYLDNISDNALIHLSLAYTYLCQGKYDLALIEADKALSDPTIFLVKASIYSCMGEFLKAEKEILLYLDKADVTSKIQGLRLIGYISLSQGKFRKAEEANKQALELAREIGEKRQQCYSHYGLAYTYLKSGEPDRAIEDIEKAWILSVEEEDMAAQRGALLLKGLIYVEMGLIDKALQTADELKRLIDSGMNKKAIGYYHHLMGMLMLKNEDFPKTIELFNQALSFLPFQRGWWLEERGDVHALFIEPLALSYYKSGDLEKAVEEYEKIISLTTGRLYYGDIYAKAFYMLGKIYEEQGDTTKAIEHYEKFLSLWKDADPGIAEVDDARERLAGMRN